MKRFKFVKLVRKLFAGSLYVVGTNKMHITILKRNTLKSFGSYDILFTHFAL